jgi:hypothetical protein
MPRTFTPQPGEGFVEALNRMLFYPDITRRGGLPQALEAALRSTGSELRVPPLSVKKLEHRLSLLPVWLQEQYRPSLLNIQMFANVGSESREVHVFCGNRGRGFRFECWSRGIQLANGNTLSLNTLARVVDRWVSTNCTTATVASEFHLVRPEPQADMYERGEEVEAGWQRCLSQQESDPTRVEFLKAAAKRPEIRQLFPLINFLHIVRFSRCTRHPFTNDTPYVQPRDDGYIEVFDPDGRSLGRGDADFAADLVVRHLPEHCGPAVVGTAEDLARP